MGSAISVVIVCAGHLGYLEGLDFAWLDALMAVSPPAQLAYPIKLVTADDEDFRALGLAEAPAVFPRSVLAHVVRQLAAAKSGVICVDLLLDAPDDGDEQLEEALSAAHRHGVPVVLACACDASGSGTWPLQRFAAHTTVGAVDVGLGPAGEVRTLKPWVPTSSGAVPSMAVAAREALRERGLLSAPDPPRGPLLVGFRSPGTSFPRYAVTDVVEGNVPNAWLRRAAVLVGRVDSRSGDRQLVSVPGEPGAGGRGLVEMAGVEVQANCLAALLSRRPPARTSMPADIAIGVLAAAAAAWLVEACGVGLGAVISIVVLLGGGVLASAVAVGSSGYVVSFMPAVLGVLVYAQLYGWMARRRLARSLGQLAGRDLLRQIGQLQAEAGVGEVVPVAVLVFDLRGTTAMAAEAPPEGVGNSISRLLAAVGERVLAHNGIVNKFLGDGLLALFTPSLGCPEAARQAIAAAQSACRLLTGDVANEWERHSGAPLRFVMAVHYGRAWLGFVGLPRRLEMTALGNIVNTTFELERAAKDRGDVFLASAEAMQEAGVSPGDEWERVEVPVRGRAKRELCYSWCERKGLSEHEGDGVGSTDVGGTGSE